MNLGLNTSLKQEQSLSPQMLQSLALLNMPVMDLKTYIQNEIESNPALEIPEREFGEQQFEDNNYTLPDDRLDDLDSSSYEGIAGDKNLILENTATESETLSRHLEKQLGVSDVSDLTEEIASLLISNLDSNGFFVMSLEALFENKDYSQEEIEKALELVQSFDPYGICVQDFRQSLILQAKCMGMAKSDLEIFSNLVNNYLEQMKNGKEKEVASSLHISTEDLSTFWSILKSLTPYPGRNFSSEIDNFITPEFSVFSKNGAIHLEINKENLPDLEISQEFASLSEDPQAASYVKEYIKKAKDLINQINLRYKTIYSTALVIMEKQKDFFVYGPKALKPMTLKDVANEVGVHETTMSRLAQSKYIETDWGTIPLKSLFTQGVQTSQDGDLSRTAVKEIIKEILSANPKLSDQKVSDALLEKGIKCARRTVNKYRTELSC